MIIIAMGHKKFVGKDTACRFMVTEYRIKHPGSTVIRKGFADKIKHVATDLYGWAGIKDMKYYEDNPNAKNDFIPPLEMTVRDVWIAIGNLMREIYQHTWLDFVLQHTIPPNLLVIPDLRYPNEFERIKMMGGYCIKINRPDIVPTPDVADNALDGQYPWDYTIENNGDMKTLHTNVISILEDIERKRNGI